MTEVSTQTRYLADVAVPVPAGDVYSYIVPPELEDTIKVGIRVRMPFANRETTGYTIGLRHGEAGPRYKSILQVIDEEPVLSDEMLKLTKQVSDYYGSSWGESIENALPKWVKFGKKAARAVKAMEDQAPIYDVPEAGNFTLTGEQEKAFKSISASIGTENPKPILIHGVTGSGKSELYIRAIRRALELDRSAIVLVPEITLTEQLKRFFASQFGGELEILHSKLSDGERFQSWKRLQQGKTRIVLGPRSAVFAPVQRLGLIIMDEEHENSYKQETTPRYHTRQVACWRAQNENALFVMGSATPSMEAVHLCETGAFRLETLTKRVDDRAMPEVMIIDLRDHVREQKRMVILSRILARQIEVNLEKGEATMLLLNRRGFSTKVHCGACGYSANCKSCQVTLTFHQETNQMLCHYCNYQERAVTECPECKANLLKFGGFGTEKVESEVGRLFPQARIARLDADTIKRKGSHEEILGKFRKGEYDILIGTQMIAKGFDFPNVTLVGVVLADVGLMLPDFRSGERTFQLLTQVAGRAGRGKKAGRVLIQTFSPAHPSVAAARTHNFKEYFDNESAERRSLNYPPYSQLINFIVRSKDEKKAYASAWELGQLLEKEFAGELKKGLPGVPALIEKMGPAPLPFYKLRGHFRWHVMLKCPHDLDWVARAHAVFKKLRKPSAVQAAVDVDPLNIL